MSLTEWMRSSYAPWLTACVIAAAATSCGVERPSTSNDQASYLREVPGTPPTTLECPVCPVAIAKLAAGEPVAIQCTEHCENCGNGICDLDETHEACSSDCSGSVCGNLVCEIGEAFNCPSDCNLQPPRWCGNRICELGEEFYCEQDCGPLDPMP